MGVFPLFSPQNLIEDMRGAFTASTEYLETAPRSERDKKEMLLEMWREQAKMYGIDPMRVRIEKERELGEELSVDDELELLTTEIEGDDAEAKQRKTVPEQDHQ